MDEFERRASSGMEGFVLRGVGGMLLAIIGVALNAVGTRGASGSGLVIDPVPARKDLEPFTRMEGGMLSDKLDEAGIDPRRIGVGAATAVRVVMVKCRGCAKPNEEDSKFRQECGVAM